MKRWPLLVLPSLTLGGAAALIAWGATARTTCAARVWGGPTDGLAAFSGWVEACAEGALLADEELLLIAGLPSGSPGTEARRETRVRLDAQGRAEFRFQFPEAPGAFELRVLRGERALAQGRVALSKTRFFGSARQRGGFLASAEAGLLRVRAAAGRGAFAVPFAAPLRLEALRGEVPEPNVSLSLRAEGARLSSTSLQTDARGRAQVELTPQEHTVFVAVQAKTQDGLEAQFRSSLPVVPGACFIERLEDGSLAVRSPVEREEAFLTLLGSAGRLAGTRVSLSPDGQGRANGTYRAPADIDALAHWAVCSSDPRGSGTSLVGWPLTMTSEDPPRTLDAPDVLLLDGLPEQTAVDRRHRRRAYTLALMWGALGGALSVGWLWASARREQVRLDHELGGVLSSAEAQRLTQTKTGARVWVFLLVGLGFLGLVALLALRLR